jgi:alpha-L-fucosidase
MIKTCFSVIFSFLLLTQSVTAQEKLSKDERMEWWREARFGMFIHWGIYSQFAGVYKDHEQLIGGAEWIMNRSKIPVFEYQEMAKKFNPTNYDPDAWVKMAKDAGMKYIVITAKHHDGFALFETKASKWNVVDATPYGKDLLKPLAEACRKYGIRLGFYYSQTQDWNNPGGAVSRRLMKDGYLTPDSTKVDAYTLAHNGHWDPIQETKTFDQYIDDVAVPQVKELLTNYGNVSVLWWDTPGSITNEEATKLQNVLKLQPNIITNDRLKRPGFLGDTKTPEQKIPTVDELDGQDWETCMTMNGTWGFRTSDHKWKSSETLIRNLIDISSKGGNYLLNVGPKPDGTFPQESIDRLKDISEWMKINSEAIYDTKASPIEAVKWGRCTRKDSKKGTILYVSVFDWPVDGKLLIPNLNNKVISAKLLSNNKKLNTSYSRDNGLTVNVPINAPDKVASVIKIEVKGKMQTKFSHDSKEMKTGALD